MTVSSFVTESMILR